MWYYRHVCWTSLSDGWKFSAGQPFSHRTRSGYWLIGGEWTKGKLWARKHVKCDWKKYIHTYTYMWPGLWKENLREFNLLKPPFRRPGHMFTYVHTLFNWNYYFSASINNWCATLACKYLTGPYHFYAIELKRWALMGKILLFK